MINYSNWVVVLMTGVFYYKLCAMVILSQENKVNNVLYINKSSEDNVLLIANIKSVSKEGFQSSRTNMIYLHNTKINIKDQYKVERITVRVLGFDIKVPLFIMFRALGFETDKLILSFIIRDNDSDTLKMNMYNILLSLY